MIGWASIPLVVIAAFAVYPLASHGHGKGIYQSKAEAEQRASELGCKSVHQKNGKWMPCGMSVNSTANVASNEPTPGFTASTQGSPLAGSNSRRSFADHRRHGISLQLALGARH